MDRLGEKRKRVETGQFLVLITCGNGSVLSIDNLPFHFLPRQYSKWVKCVFVPIRKRSAVQAKVIVVSCRSRCAILTFFGSPLCFCPNIFSIQNYVPADTCQY